MKLFSVNIYDLAFSGRKIENGREFITNRSQAEAHDTSAAIYKTLPWGKWFVVTIMLMLIQFGFVIFRLAAGGVALYILITGMSIVGPPLMDYAQNWQFKSKAAQIVKDTRSVTDQVSVEDVLVINKITNIGCFVMRIEEGATGLIKKIVHVVDVEHSTVIMTGDWWQNSGLCKKEDDSKKEAEAKSLIKSSDIKIFNARMSIYNNQPTIWGTINNNSKHTVSSVTVSITVDRCDAGKKNCKLAGESVSDIVVEVPPSESRDFTVSPLIKNLSEMPDFTWNEDIRYITAKIE